MRANFLLCSLAYVYYNYSREQLKQLISNLNVQKCDIKKGGITVDGKKCHINFTGRWICTSLIARDLQHVVQNGTLLRIKPLTLLKGGGC